MLVWKKQCLFRISCCKLIKLPTLTVYVTWIWNRFLHLVLYTAERAWSHAMEKRQLPDGPNSRQRIYLIGRLRKAVKWATLFAQLCAIKGDSRTSLEAEVCLYISFHHQVFIGFWNFMLKGVWMICVSCIKLQAVSSVYHFLPLIHWIICRLLNCCLIVLDSECFDTSLLITLFWELSFS